MTTTVTNERFDANPWKITAYVARRYPRMLIGRRWLHVVVADPALLDTLPQTTADWDPCLGIPAQLTAASAAGFTDAQLAAAAAQWGLANRDEAACTALARMPRLPERFASRPVVELQHLACAEAAVALLKAHGEVSAEGRRADVVHTEALPTVVHRVVPDAWCAVSGDPHSLWLDGLLGLAPDAGRAWAGAPPLQAAVVHGGPWLQPSVFTRLGTGPWRGLAGPAAAAVRADAYRLADVDEDGPAVLGDRCVV